MSLVTWQDLCLDAVDVATQSRFWAAVGGLDRVGHADPARLVGPTARHTLWVNQVDRPHRVKNRVHLDVDCASLADLVDLGARVLSPAERTGRAWSVLADPEGNEFCAFVRPPDELPDQRIHGVVVDCPDPESTARWWGGLFGVVPARDDEGDWWTVSGVAAGGRTTLDFVPVPEPRSEPNRVHWDVVGRVADLLDRGATHVRDQERWTVMADPDGNEFCVFAPT